MNRSWVSKFAGLVLVLTLISSSLVAGTYAKYTTEVKATGSVTVAKWQADLEGVGTTTTGAVTFDLIGTLGDTGVDGNLLAPGTVGSFALAYDTNNSQVARNVTILLDVSAPSAALSHLKFYADEALETEFESPSAGILELLNKDFGPTEDGSDSVTVYWAWVFEDNTTTDGAIAYDAADTTDGIAGLSYAVTATFTATQRNTF
ncbi:MAG: hypothetical protein PHH65_05355 [Eubacteriales bacterium]|nr:hypothetical protein [Eubacteriales bacterium]